MLTVIATFFEVDGDLLFLSTPLKGDRLGWFRGLRQAVNILGPDPVLVLASYLLASDFVWSAVPAETRGG